jgi:hypothetical protein
VWDPREAWGKLAGIAAQLCLGMQASRLEITRPPLSLQVFQGRAMDQHVDFVIQGARARRRLLTAPAHPSRLCEQHWKGDLVNALRLAVEDEVFFEVRGRSFSPSGAEKRAHLMVSKREVWMGRLWRVFSWVSMEILFI